MSLPVKSAVFCIAVILAAIAQPLGSSILAAAQTKSERAQPLKEMILKSLEKRQTMVNAIAALIISEPPICKKPLPPDTPEKAATLALVYGYQVDDPEFRRDVKAAWVELTDRMSKDQQIREGICAWAQAVSGLAHEVSEGLAEYKRRGCFEKNPNDPSWRECCEPLHPPR
jgi:hypothetical protein